jgi:hypothetical protein
MIPASDFFHGFLHEYGIQLQHLPPNVVLQLSGFVVVCEAFLGIEPNKDLFRWVFEVKTHKAHGFDGGILALVGGMNIQMRYGASHSYPCLSSWISNFGWHGNWFYIHDDVTTPLPWFSVATPVRLESWSQGYEWGRSKKVLEILRILEGQVSAGLNGVAALRTMVERWVQPLKLQARVLCDFARVGDMS